MEFKRSDYVNFLDKLPRYLELRKRLSDMRYIPAPRYDASNSYEYDIEVTYNITLPRFNNVLLDYICRYNNLPTEEEFCDFYYNTHLPFFEDNGIASAGYKRAIYNRCMRAYPSLLRDILFGKYLQSKGMDVIYNVTLDSKAEIDLMVIVDGENYGIHLFTNTARANAHRRDKDGRYQLKFDNVTHIDMGIDLFKCTKVNNLGLYEGNEYNKLLSLINNA